MRASYMAIMQAESELWSEKILLLFYLIKMGDSVTVCSSASGTTTSTLDKFTNAAFESTYYFIAFSYIWTKALVTVSFFQLMFKQFSRQKISGITCLAESM